jgi:hypothetical protein
MGMRWVAGLLCALFVVAAAVQWNDPDPLLWIVAYLFAAGVSGAAASGRSNRAVNLAGAVVFGIWFATLAPSLVGAESAAFESFAMQEARHEEPREAAGLALAAAWFGFLAWRGPLAGRD